MGVLDYVLISLITAAVILAVVFCVRSRKRGKTCGGDCSLCAGCDAMKGGSRRG